MSLDSVRQQEQNSVFVLSASKYISEKSDFSRVALTYPILKSKFLKSTKFATGRFLLAAAHTLVKRLVGILHHPNEVFFPNLPSVVYNNFSIGTGRLI